MRTADADARRARRQDGPMNVEARTLGPATLDVARCRTAFPALALGVAHFDGPGGSQVPRQVADAVAGAMTSGLANRGSVTEAERRADEITLGARTAVADL